jgi:hypothetical protein
MPTMEKIAAASLKALLGGTLDYAGLFAPASLNMKASVANYARYLRHPQRWLLGRFVLPAAKLEEFLEAHERVVPLDEDEVRTDAGPDEALEHPWRLTAIFSGDVLSGDMASELDAIEEFNRGTHGAVFESAEVRVSTPEEVAEVQRVQIPGIRMFMEIPPEQTGELLPLIGRRGGHAKLRMGGVVAEAIPSVETTADFVARCAELEVSFKATAGLHHALRGEHPLSYAADSAQSTVHGFLNLFTAAAIAWNARRSGAPVSRATLAASLADSDRVHWDFTETALWTGYPEPLRIDVGMLDEVRTKFALSFGSCSFEEPVEELHELGLL